MVHEQLQRAFRHMEFRAARLASEDGLDASELTDLENYLIMPVQKAPRQVNRSNIANDWTKCPCVHYLPDNWRPQAAFDVVLCTNFPDMSCC